MGILFGQSMGGPDDRQNHPWQLLQPLWKGGHQGSVHLSEAPLTIDIPKSQQQVMWEEGMWSSSSC